MGNIHDWGQKIKVLSEDGARDIGLPLVVLLVAFASFGLGRLSGLEEGKAPISILYASSTAERLALTPGGQFVSAKGGSEYFYPWCSGAQKLTENEKIWFMSEDAAKKAGLTAAKNCRGLTP